jgi:hypothetical protein
MNVNGKEKIYRIYRKTVAAVAIFLSATVFTEGILQAQKRSGQGSEVVQTNQTETVKAKQETKPVFINEDLHRDGVRVDFGYRLLGKDSSSRGPESSYDDVNRRYDVNVFVRQGMIEIETNFAWRTRTTNSSNKYYIEPYQTRYFSPEGNERESRVDVFACVSKSIRVSNFIEGLGISVGGKYERNTTTENVVSTQNDYYKSSYLVAFPDGSYWQVHSEKSKDTSNTDYEYNLFGPGGKIGIDFSIFGVDIPIRVKGAWAGGTMYKVSSYQGATETNYSVYTSTGGYIGDSKSTRTYNSQDVFAGRIEKYFGEVSLSFSISNTLVRPSYRKTITSTEKRDSKSTSTEDKYSIDIVQALNLKNKNISVLFGFGYELTDRVDKSKDIENKYQEHSGKITVGVRF